MRLAVAGLWHTGTVTAAGLASKGVRVMAYDDSSEVVSGLRKGRLPVLEPGLAELIGQEVEKGNLIFTDDVRQLREVQGVWLCYDTPVDDHDEADVEFVLGRATRILAHLAPGAFVLVSSQLPVGSTRKIAEHADPEKRLIFSYVPENLRLGKAIDSFLKPSRVVVGLAAPKHQERLVPLFSLLTDKVEWMSIESAEVSKHALNAFLAASVAFTNEIAAICERVGGDAQEVERALRSEPRVGPKAYVRAGGAFAGGTLGRDLAYLKNIQRREGLNGEIFPAILASNENHKEWPCRKLEEVLGTLQAKVIAILGLTYTPGTSTLRRSASIEMARWLNTKGAVVKGFDPLVKTLPEAVPAMIRLQPSIEEALKGAAALVIGSECPEFLSLRSEDVVSWMRDPVVIDMGRFLENNLGGNPRIRYCAVGRSR